MKHPRFVLPRLLITAALVAAFSFPSFAGQWQQDEGGWWYENDDDTYPVNAWKWINSKYYYFDENGYMLSDTTTPDGYRVGADGAFVPGPGQTGREVAGVRCGDEDAVLNMWLNNEGLPVYQNEIHEELECYVIDPRVDSFMFVGEDCNLTPDAHEIWLYGVGKVNGKPVVLGDITMMPFEYDKIYSMDFTGNDFPASTLSGYCTDHDITIFIHVVDKTKYSLLVGNPASTWRYHYATESSIQEPGSMDRE